MLGDRRVITVFSALLQARHYRAIRRMRTRVPAWPIFLARYLTGRGQYPRDLKLTVAGQSREIRLYSHHDLLTVNEIFCREDYRLPKQLQAKTIVDIGANIGIATLYFLMTGTPDAHVYAYEPLPDNARKLRCNLSGLRTQFTLEEAAVATTAGTVDFGFEPSGRYGGIGRSLGGTMTVPCVALPDILSGIIATRGYIDLLKIDVEGLEEELVASIPSNLHRRIGIIYAELPYTTIELAGHTLSLATGLAVWSPSA